MNVANLGGVKRSVPFVLKARKARARPYKTTWKVTAPLHKPASSEAFLLVNR